MSNFESLRELEDASGAGKCGLRIGCEVETFPHPAGAADHPAHPYPAQIRRVMRERSRLCLSLTRPSHQTASIPSPCSCWNFILAQQRLVTASASSSGNVKGRSTGSSLLKGSTLRKAHLQRGSAGLAGTTSFPGDRLLRASGTKHRHRKLSRDDLEHTHFLATLVNEFRFGYTQFQNDQQRFFAFQRNVTGELGIIGLTCWCRRPGEPRRSALAWHLWLRRNRERPICPAVPHFPVDRQSLADSRKPLLENGG